MSNAHPRLKPDKESGQDADSLERIVRSLAKNTDRLIILEAGCGSQSHFRHAKDDYLIGVDISQEQLDKSTYLHEKILGDIQETQILPDSHFDVIICWDVLEHLPRPERALDNFSRALRPGGVMLLGSPNVLSLRGLLTKMSPHWLKVVYYRHVVGNPDAGKPGNYPFRSYHRFSISPPAIRKFAQRKGLSVELYAFSSWQHPENRYLLFNMIWSALNHVVRVISFGIIGTDDKQGFKIILRKPEKPTSFKT